MIPALLDGGHHVGQALKPSDGTMPPVTASADERDDTMPPVTASADERDGTMPTVTASADERDGCR